MPRADRRKRPVRALQREHGDVARVPIAHRHMHRIDLSPQAEQRPVAGRQLLDRQAPTALARDHARPRAVALDSATLDRVDARRHGLYPKSFATFWNQVTSAGGR